MYVLNSAALNKTVQPTVDEFYLLVSISAQVKVCLRVQSFGVSESLLT